MASASTRADRLVTWLKNHPVSSVLVVLGLIIVALGSVTNALTSILGVFVPDSGLEVAAVRVIDEPAEITKFRKTWLPAETTVTIWDTLQHEVLEATSKRVDGNLVITPTGRRHMESQLVRGALGGFPIIDIIVRNQSSEVVLLTDAKLTARRLTVEAGSHACSPIVPTWAYHVLLDSDTSRQVVTTSLAQEVPAHGADRFVIVLGHDGSVGEATYQVAIELLHSPNRSVSLGGHRVRIGSLCGAGPPLRVPYRLPAQ